MTKSPMPHPEVPKPALTRALAVVAAIAAKEVTGCLLGGLGVAAHRHGTACAALDRTYSDVDIVVGKEATGSLTTALADDYVPNKRFNALHGANRLVFHRIDDGEQLDVFVGSFAMCHTLELTQRLATGGPALAPADLLLTKAQVVEMTNKDVIDLVTLLHSHEVVEAELDPSADVIDLDRLVEVCAGDWGWHTTVTTNLPLVAAQAAALLPIADSSKVAERIATIEMALDLAPKSFRWRARARVGRRLPWYELPEEVAHG